MQAILHEIWIIPWELLVVHWMNQGNSYCFCLMYWLMKIIMSRWKKTFFKISFLRLKCLWTLSQSCKWIEKSFKEKYSKKKISLYKRVSVPVKWKMHFNLHNVLHKDRNWDELNTELWKMKCIINIRNVIEYFYDSRGGKYFKIFHSKTQSKNIKFYFIWLISFAK